MSKINAFRAVNVNYNNNAIRIEDETFHYEGESTLLSLANGGGKSVLVQMMMAPFVHKRYRDMPDRPFSSYFTTNKPTFLMVEWKLDGDSGYVLTGMMVRARQTTTEQDSAEDLEMVNFIHEYKQPDGLDLASLPIIEIEGTTKKLKGFNVVRQLFEELKKDRKRDFYCYDMSQSVQQRGYFQKLKEYGIDCAEWENIIKKINLKESGLSELFKEAKDEAGLIEKWFLMAVDSKLNQQENKVKQFQQILFKYISQYKENESKMEQKQTILLFQEDTKAVEEKALEQIEADDKKRAYEEKIAFLRSKLEEYLQAYQLEQKQAENSLQESQNQIEEIQYEEISVNIYQLKEQIQKLTESMSAEQNRNRELVAEVKELQHKIDVLECAKLSRKYLEEFKELHLIENRLKVAKADAQKILPERENLGYTLRLYYENQAEQLDKKIAQNRQQLSEVGQNGQKIKQQLTEKRTELNDYGKEIGKASERIHQYDAQETQFQNRFQQKLERNILGLYEEGTLEVLTRQYNKQQEEDAGLLRNKRAEKLKLSEIITELERDLQDHRGTMATLDATYREMNKKWNRCQEQLKKRVELLRYIDFEEKDQFDTERILAEFQKKINALTEIMYRFQKDKNQLVEERNAVKSGQVIKLPKELEELFHKLDLHYITGMEWIKKNGYSVQKNEALVKANPMLPYSIIMNGQALERLKKESIEFFTSYPIPIIRHEDVEVTPDCVTGAIYDAERIQFFVVFNHHLLDAKALSQLLEQMQLDIDVLENQCHRKQEEISFYSDVSNEIRYQTVTQENYEELQEKLVKQQELIQESNEQFEQLQSKKAQSHQRVDQLDTLIQELEQKVAEEKELVQSFQRLQEAYKTYCEEKLQLSMLHRKEAEIKNHIQRLEKEQVELQQTGSQLEDVRRDLVASRKICQLEISRYEAFQKGEKIEQNIQELEARYEAITNQLGTNVKDLEEQRTKAFKRVTDAKEELLRTADKRGVSQNDYESTEYDAYKQEQYERSLADKEKEKNESEGRISEYDKKIAVQSDRLQRSTKELMVNYGTEEPKSMDQIVDLQFTKRKKLVQEQIKDEKAKLKHIGLIVNGYQSNLTAMSEYELFSCPDSCNLEYELADFQKDSIAELSMKELEQFRGELCRDYKNQERIIQNLRNDQSKILDGLLRKEVYAKESVHHPLETMVELLDQPRSLYQQLVIVTESYQALLEKLEIDLRMVNKEKENIMEMMMDYLSEVHSNLDKIDKNSTIQVKGRAIKMVRLKLPVWEDEKDSYRIRLNEYMDRVTNRSMERLEANGNIEELIGALMTTRNLYDSVVGISSIEIRLYKIEADREYPISWAEVSKNSGGEGFLSAFAVLSCLLSYMRRNESDLFLEREEGKVIIMDNPFAQTNASHLLIPLMDIAKKSNTQLICLSGLSGESIYNRFDNIYVMNLIGSNLQKDLKYLKAEQIKGDAKVYTMSTSRFQVEPMEQMELLF